MERKIMATRNINLFTSNLTGKALITEKKVSKQAVKNALADYAATIDAEFTLVIKSTDVKARNVANAAKGKYKTALQVVVACYPYQTAEGVLCAKKKTAEGARVWAEKKLTAASARGIIRTCLDNFIKTVGAPEVHRVVLGAPVE